jgi:hypothetical protein
MPIYWKPKYGTRSSRHKAWVREQRKREAALRREPSESLRERLRRIFKRPSGR